MNPQTCTCTCKAHRDSRLPLCGSEVIRVRPRFGPTSSEPWNPGFFLVGQEKPRFFRRLYLQQIYSSRGWDFHARPSYCTTI